MNATSTSPLGSAKPAKDLNYKFPLLVSYHYLRHWPKPDREYITSGEADADGFEIMLDSGAFSAKNVGAVIDLDEYMEFLSLYGSCFKGGYVSLDVLGDPHSSMRNLKQMVKENLTPMPVHVWGATQKEMDELFELSTKVCLGGFRRPGRGSAPKQYVVEKMRWAAGRDVHWLGYTNKNAVTVLLPHSVDCASWKSARMFATMFMYEGNGQGGNVDKAMARSRPLNRKQLQLLKDCNPPISRMDLDNDENWKGNASMSQKVTTLSWVKYVMDLRERFGVRNYLACGGYQIDFVAIRDQLQPERKRRKEAARAST